MANRKYKDSLFRSIFKHPKELVSLSRALFPQLAITHRDIKVNTLASVLMDGQKNDISYLLAQKHIVLLEHQSTWNQNMPLRLFWYASELFRHTIQNKSAMYQEALIPIPTPHFYMLYAGNRTLPDVSTLRLSDAFMEKDSEPQLELAVTVLNISYSPERAILKTCRTLHDYSFFVHQVEQNIHAQGATRDEAIRAAMDDCIRRNILADFIRENYKEVIDMVSLRYDINEAIAFKQEEACKGKTTQFIQNLLKMKMSYQDIAKAADTSLENVHRIAKESGISL